MYSIRRFNKVLCTNMFYRCPRLESISKQIGFPFRFGPLYSGAQGRQGRCGMNKRTNKWFRQILKWSSTSTLQLSLFAQNQQYVAQTGTNAELVGVCDGRLERPAFGRPLETYGWPLLGKTKTKKKTSTKTKTKTVLKGQGLDRALQSQWLMNKQVCGIDFDLLIKFEQLSREEEYLRERLRLQDVIGPRWNILSYHHSEWKMASFTIYIGKIF